DAFKRAAMRFGVGHELYTDYDILWVQVDGDGKYARPVEEPSEVYARKQGKVSEVKGENPPADVHGGKAAGNSASSGSNGAAGPASAPASAPQLDEPTCPKCGGRMWDNRIGKR